MYRSNEFADYLNRARIPNLDGLRGLAVLLVLAHHAPSAAWDLGAQFQHNGKHGVSLFFAISGYIVMTLMLREYRRTRAIDLKGFLWRRALRLWPLYYLILLGESVLVYVAQVYSPENQLLFSDKLTCYVLYCSNWLVNSGEGPFFVAWSLAVEEQFYLLLSLLIVILRPGALPAVIGGLLVIKVLLINVVGVDPSTLPWRVVLSYSEAILMGVLLAFLLDGRKGFAAFRRLAATPTRAMIWLTAFVALLVFVPLQDKSDPPALAFYLVCTLLVGACAVNDRLPIIGGRALSRVGLVSYGIYLMHMPVLSAVKKITTDPMLVMLGTLALVLPLALLSFAVFEEPIRQLGRKWFRAHSPDAAPDIPASVGEVERVQAHPTGRTPPVSSRATGRTTADGEFTPGCEPVCELSTRQ